MNIVTGVFDTAHNAEDALRALLDAGFKPEDISLATNSQEKGERLARETDREYRWPSGDELTGRDAVYDRLPNTYLDAIRRSNLGDDGANWYHDRFNEGRFLMIVDAGDRHDDVGRLIQENHGMLYRERRETRERYEERAREGREGYGDRRERMAQTSREPVERDVTGIPLIREEVRVERRALDRPLSPDEYQRLQAPEDEIHVPIIQEDVRIERTQIVREELVITRARMEGRRMTDEELEAPPEERKRRRPAA